jgi:hypothetical protein
MKFSFQGPNVDDWKFLKLTEPVGVVVNANKEPPITCFTHEKTPGESLQESIHATNYLLWIILRKLNMADQTLSTYSGWRTCVKKLNSTTPLKKTVLKYLPPINAKVTEFSTIYQCLTYLQLLASEVNMPYVNVTLDVGACCHECRKGAVELSFEIPKRYYSLSRLPLHKGKLWCYWKDRQGFWV